MSDIFRSAVEQYARILPEDLRDTEVYLNHATLAEIERIKPSMYLPLPSQILGLPVRIDDNMPDGVVALRTENKFDRAIRRANERGHAFNIVKPATFTPEVLPAPPPTVRALVRHWCKSVREKVRRG